MELSIEAIAIPNGNAGLIFEFKNKVAPAVQDLDVVAFEGRVRQSDNVIDAVAVGCKYIRDPDVGVGDINGDKCGIYTAEVIGNSQRNLLWAARTKDDTLISTLKIKVAAIRKNPGPGAEWVEACAGISKLDNLIDILVCHWRWLE